MNYYLRKKLLGVLILCICLAPIVWFFITNIQLFVMFLLAVALVAGIIGFVVLFCWGLSLIFD